MQIKQTTKTLNMTSTYTNTGDINSNQKETPPPRRIDKLLGKKDIKYRGIFSSRMVKIIGFIFLFCAQIYVCIRTANKLITISPQVIAVGDIMETLSYYSLPMFLAANFCVIMTSKNKIKKMLINYSIIALGVYLMVLFVFYRYMLGVANVISDGDTTVAYEIADLIAKRIFGRVINYNVFVDLSIFSLFYFFLFYTPKNITKKRSIIAFRSLCSIPILLALIATLLYGLYSLETIDLPVAVLAIMPCRSLTIYVIFFGIALAIKLRQKIFAKYGGTPQEYEMYSLTNRSSLEISVISALIILVVCLLDLLISRISFYTLFFGIGVNFYLILSAPPILLLSYTRKTKSSIWDAVIIAVFILTVIILYLETGLYIINNIN